MKHKKLLWFVLLVIVSFLILFSIPSVTVYEAHNTLEVEVEPEVPTAQAEEVEVPSKPQVPELYPTLKRICSCESTGQPDREPQQFNADGSVKRGKINPLDTGMCQINLHYHEEAATKMGLDLETSYGNATYANWLFDREGSTPWNWSRSCWAE